MNESPAARKLPKRVRARALLLAAGGALLSRPAQAGGSNDGTAIEWTLAGPLTAPCGSAADKDNDCLDFLRETELAQSAGPKLHFDEGENCAGIAANGNPDWGKPRVFFQVRPTRFRSVHPNTQHPWVFQNPDGSPNNSHEHVNFWAAAKPSDDPGAYYEQKFVVVTYFIFYPKDCKDLGDHIGDSENVHAMFATTGIHDNLARWRLEFVDYHAHKATVRLGATPLAARAGFTSHPYNFVIAPDQDGHGSHEGPPSPSGSDCGLAGTDGFPDDELASQRACFSNSTYSANATLLGSYWVHPDYAVNIGEPKAAPGTGYDPTVHSFNIDGAWIKTDALGNGPFSSVDLHGDGVSFQEREYFLPTDASGNPQPPGMKNCGWSCPNLRASDGDCLSLPSTCSSTTWSQIWIDGDTIYEDDNVVIWSGFEKDQSIRRPVYSPGSTGSTWYNCNFRRYDGVTGQTSIRFRAASPNGDPQVYYFDNNGPGYYNNLAAKLYTLTADDYATTYRYCQLSSVSSTDCTRFYDLKVWNGFARTIGPNPYQSAERLHFTRNYGDTGICNTGTCVEQLECIYAGAAPWYGD